MASTGGLLSECIFVSFLVCLCPLVGSSPMGENEFLEGPYLRLMRCSCSLKISCSSGSLFVCACTIICFDLIWFDDV